MVLPPALIQIQPAPDSLAAAWPHLAWSVAARGALLAVAVEDVQLPPPSTLPPPPRDGYNAADLLLAFDRTLARFPTITAVATPTMRLYEPPRTPLALAQALKDINPEPYALLFLSSLTPAQRQQAAAPQGLALSALQDRQRDWLVALTPESVTFQVPLTADRELEPGDRAELRLRVQRTLEITATAENPSESAYSLTGLPTVPTIARKLALQNPPPESDPEWEFLSRKRVPARLKPGELLWETPALNTAVSLTGLRTVGELTARLARVTKISLYASAPLAQKSLLIRGTSARAGDALRALCRCLNATVRRLSDEKESLYLLVEDLPTAAARREQATGDYLKLQAPAERERRQLTQLAASARRQLTHAREGTLLPRSEQDAPESLWALAERFDQSGTLSVTELTPELRQEIQEQYRARRALVDQFGGATPVQPTRVAAQQSVSLQLLLPALGGVAALAQFDTALLRTDQALPAPTAPLKIPATCTIRAAMVALPATDQEGEALVALARSRGLTELRFPLPPGEEHQKHLRAIAVLAKKAGLGVVPVLSPLAPLTGQERADRDAEGRTFAQWEATRIRGGLTAFDSLVASLLPEGFVAPEAVDVAAFARSVARLAALPGVTGIGLEGLAAPGYPGAEPEDWPLWTGGYDPSLRLAFVRQHGLDPADLVLPTPFGQLLGGVEPDERVALWTELLIQRRDDLIRRLADALEKIPLPVPLCVLASRLGQSGHWARWQGRFPTGEVRVDEAGERLPLVARAARPGLLHVRGLSYRTRLTALAADLETLQDDDARFRDWLDTELQAVLRPNPEHPDAWEGFVLDLTDRTLTEALSVVEQALAATEEKP